MKTQVLGFLLPLTAVVAMARPADAATVSYSTSFSGLQPSSSSISVTLPQYNPNLGALQYVDLSFSANSTFVINATNLSYPAASENAQVTAQQPITLQFSTFSATGSSTGTSDVEVVPGYTDPTTGGSITMNSFTGTGSLTAQFLPSSLISQFIGTGTVTISLVPSQLNLNGTAASGADISYLNDTSNTTTTFGTVTVDYNVPEPLTTAGTVVAGAMGLWIKRRQRKAA